MDLKQLSSLQKTILTRKKERKHTIYICVTGCRASGSLELIESFRNQLTERGLEEQVAIVGTGCHGKCSGSPLIRLEPEGFYYGKVGNQDIGEILDRTVLKGEKIDRLYTGSSLFDDEETGFFGHQKKELLKSCGLVDPTDIEDAIGAGSYFNAGRVLETLHPMM